MRKLRAYEIEVKVKQVGAKGAVLLLYKTARVDMAILDETFGAMNWQSDYKVVKDNLIDLLRANPDLRKCLVDLVEEYAYYKDLII